jgi:hypothetical protein
MFREKRRAERIKIRVPVAVELYDDKTKTVLAGPVAGEVRDFSPLGIALSLASIMIGPYHVFFTCQDNPSHIIRIGFTLPDEPEEILNIPARPVWYDRYTDSKEKKALLGVEFLLKPKDAVIKKLTTGLFPETKTPTSWWKIF